MKTTVQWLMFEEGSAKSTVLTHTNEQGKKLEISISLYDSASRLLESHLLKHGKKLTDEKKKDAILLICTIELKKENPSDTIDPDEHAPLLRLFT